jgi:uncharacterized delta-60 repeat protein
MRKLCKFVAVLAALCVASAAMALGASAAKPHGTKADKGTKKAKSTGVRPDPSFGRDGIARIATSEPPEGFGLSGSVQMAFGPESRVYALQGLQVLGFEADGKPDRDFGNNGRVRIESARGVVDPTGLAVDAEGRVLVSGTLTLTPYSEDQPVPAGTSPTVWGLTLKEAFVVRLLADGTHDPSFGSGGEVDTTFNVPRPLGKPGSGVEYEHALVEANTLTLDPQGRPVVGGGFVDSAYFCGDINDRVTAFTGRLTTNGAVDTSYAGKGYTTGTEGAVMGAAATPEGGVATLNWARPFCALHGFPTETTFSAWAENGGGAPGLDPARPRFYSSAAIAVDSQDRALVVQEEDPFSEGAPKLVRLLPSGAVDTSFGFGGGIPLTKPVEGVAALAVDGQGRAIVGDEGSLARYTAAGKKDSTFGKKGALNIGTTGNETTEVTSLSVQPKGRIYAAAWVKNKSLKTGFGIQITRLLPGS